MALEILEIDPKAGVPKWYWTWKNPEFDAEDELVLSHLAERIHENIEVRPEGERPEDLMMVGAKRNIVTTTVERDILTIRVLDAWGDIMKASDFHISPKLNLIAQLMWISRFDLDGINLYTPSYGEVEFGGVASMTSHVSHVPKERALEYMGGIDNIKVPDFHKDGAYPKYLWVIKELKGFFRKYNLRLPLSASSCPDPAGCAIVLFGPERMKRIAKEDPELMHKALKLGYEYSLTFSRALYVAGADFVWHCAHLNDVDINSIKEYGYDQYNRDLYKKCQIFAGPIGKLSKDHAELFAGFDATGCSIEEKEDLLDDLKVFKEHRKYATSIVDINAAAQGSKNEIKQDILYRYKTATSLGVQAFNVTVEYRDYVVPMENVEYTIEQLKEIGRAFVQGKIK